MLQISAIDASASKKTLHNRILINYQPFHLYHPPAIGTRWGLDPFPDKDGTLSKLPEDHAVFRLLFGKVL